MKSNELDVLVLSRDIIENDITHSKILSAAELMQYYDMKQAVQAGEDIFSGKFALENYEDFSEDDVTRFFSILKLIDVKSSQEKENSKQEKQNETEKKSYAHIICLSIISFVICCIGAGFVRAIFWDWIVVSVISYLTKTSLSTLILIFIFIPSGSLVLFIGGYGPVILFTMMTNKIAKMSHQNKATKDGIMKWTGTFCIIFSVLCILSILLASFSNGIAHLWITGLVECAILFITGVFMRQMECEE